MNYQSQILYTVAGVRVESRTCSLAAFLGGGDSRRVSDNEVEG